MAQELYWSITADGVGPSTPPPGLECAVEDCNSLLVLYLVNNSDPAAALVDTEHADVLGASTVRGRQVAMFVVTILTATYISLTKEWQFHLQYDETALVDGVEAITKCDVCQAECLSCEVQAKLGANPTFTGDNAAWEAGYEAFLTANPGLDFGDLPDA